MDLLAYLLGLPVLAGMNPYATAFTIGALRRADLVADPVLLGSAFAPFARDGWLVVFGILAAMHSLADKIPGLNHLNDMVHTLIKPFAGALLGLAAVDSLRADGSLPLLVIAVACSTGASLAFVTHASRSGLRFLAAKLSCGLLTPALGVLEDVAVVGGSAVAVTAPYIFLVGTLGCLVLGVWMTRSLMRVAVRRKPARHRNR